VLAQRWAPIRSSADAEILEKLRVQRTCVGGFEGARVGLRLRLRIGEDVGTGVSSVVASPPVSSEEVGGATSWRERRPGVSFFTLASPVCDGGAARGAGEAVLPALMRGGRPRGFFALSLGRVEDLGCGLRGSKAGALGETDALGVPGVATGVHLVALPVLRTCLETGVFG
jgi:hypothetical protein